MRILENYSNSFKKDSFHKTFIDTVDYIPFFVHHIDISVDNSYSKPCFKNTLTYSNTIRNIKTNLESSLRARKIIINNRVYFFIKGCVFSEEGLPLLLLAMPREKFLDPHINKFSVYRYGTMISPPDYSSYVLFYSTSFFTDPNLASLNRRFQKEILMSCYEKGIEVRVITSQEIERNTFADLFEIPKANSVSQLEEYMNTVLPNYLYTEEEDNFVFNSLTQVKEELSLEEEALWFDPEANIEPEEHLEELAELALEAATWDSAHTELQIPNRNRSTIELIDDEG